VANETLVGTHITKRLHELHNIEPLDATLIVPTQGSDFGTAVAEAYDRMERGIEAIQALGIEAQGRIGDPDPMTAIHGALKANPAINLILISTLPLGASKWIAMDLPHRIQRRFGEAVEHLEGAPIDSEPYTRPPGLAVKVLVVEDDPADLELTKLALEELDADVQVLVSGTGQGAVHFMRESASRPDLILLDLKMPTMDGFTMLEEFGSTLGIDTLNELNVAVVSSSSAQSDRDRAHALGAQAYVVKQPDFDEFSNALGSLVAEVLAHRSP